MAGHRAPEQREGALIFFGGKWVTWSKKAGDSTTRHNWEAGDILSNVRFLQYCKHVSVL